MRRARFTISRLMIWVVAAAVVMAVVMSGRDSSCRVILALAISALVLVPCAGLPARRLRAFGLGFALFGWGYGLLWMLLFGRLSPPPAWLETAFPAPESTRFVNYSFVPRAWADIERSRILLQLAAHALVALMFAALGGSAFHLLGGRKIDDDPIVDPLEGRLLNPEHTGRITDGAPDRRQPD